MNHRSVTVSMYTRE